MMNDAPAVTGRWQPANDGFLWLDGETPVWKLHLPDRRPISLHRFDKNQAESAVVELLGAAYRENQEPLRAAGWGERRPYIQGANLVVPQDLDSTVELGLTLWLRPEKQGRLLLEATLTTVKPVAEVRLDFGVAGDPTSACELPFDPTDAAPPRGAAATATSARLIHVRRQGERLVSLLADGGDNGCLEFTKGDSNPAAHPADLSVLAVISCFRQPLEKGVILVGRLAIVPPVPERTQAEWEAAAVQFKEQRTFL